MLSRLREDALHPHYIIILLATHAGCPEGQYTRRGPERVQLSKKRGLWHINKRRMFRGALGVEEMRSVQWVILLYQLLADRNLPHADSELVYSMKYANHAFSLHRPHWN